MDTYMILGGGGAFGIHCAKYLLDAAEVEGVCGVGRAPLRPEAFSLGIDKAPRYRYIQAHVGHELDLLLEVMDDARPRYIINFAAQGEGAASWRHSWRFFDTNSTALARLYEELGKRDYVERFVHIGTSELYGSVRAPAAEDAPIRPSSPYAASKAAFDLYLLAMAAQGKGPPMNIIRPSNCYCSGQLLHRIIPRAIVAGLTGRKVPLHGGGAARKSYLHARDLARAILMVIERAPAGRVYNAGPPEPIAIREVAHKCAYAVGQHFDDLFVEVGERLGQDGCYWLDSSAIALEVGWGPTIGWSEGLEEVRRWAVDNFDFLRDWPTDYQLRA